MRDKSRAMLAASEGRHTFESGGKFTEKSTEEAIFATDIKHKQEEHDEEAKATRSFFLTGLKACALKKDLHQVSRIHNELHRRGLLQKDTFLGSTLVNVYAKCGALTKAQEVLDVLPVRTVITWNSLIAGYAQRGCGKEALCCFHGMRREGLSPDGVSYVCTLKACGLMQDLHMGERIHNEISSQGLLEKDVVLGGALVDMYAKCGALTRAQKVLDELPFRDVVSWSALIAGYAQHGFGKQALGCFNQMRREGLSPNAITYACTLKACGHTQDIDMGERIHDVIASQGLLEKDAVLGNALVDMYAKCGALSKARKILDGHPLRDVVTWSALIAGYAQHGRGKEALGCFNQMRREGLSPNAITYACTLKACGLTQDVDMGERIHDEIASQGLLEKHIVLGNALVDVYAKCGALTKAREVFNGLPLQNVISWSVLMAGYVQHGCGTEALGCFHQIRRESLSPNAITYACTLKACGLTQDLHMGERIHNEIASQGLLEKDVVLGNALIDMYAKCGALAKAQKVLDGYPLRDVVSWSALIAGYAQHGYGKEALFSFHRMRREGLSPNAITYASTLKACGVLQDVDMGERIHNEIASQGLLEKHVVLGGALVDMYAKCGALTKAREVLDGLPVRTVVSWNALIAGYAQHGSGKEALGCFSRMQSEGILPDEVSWSALIGGYAQQGLAEEAMNCFCWMQQEGTAPSAITFLIVLNACSHSGLLDEGQMLFDSMREKYGIIPDKKHYSCMVDLFGRARHFDKAMKVINMMPSSDYPPVWSALLGACRQWGNLELGRLAFERSIELDRCNAGAYVFMSNIYAAAGMQEEARMIERMRIRNCAEVMRVESLW